MSEERRREERALARVLAEAKTEPVEEPDWTRLERRLLDLPPPSPPRVQARGLASAAVGLAAAAAVLLAVFWPLERQSAPTRATASVAAPQPQSGDAPAPPTRLVADESEIVVEHAGRSRFTLLLGSAATVRDQDGVTTVKLERGAVDADVVPGQGPESFVVEAASTRVAVRGTRFRVTLSSAGVHVDVSEGTVLVGPRAEPGTGTSLSAPAESRFTLAGSPVSPSSADKPQAWRASPAASESAHAASPAPSSEPAAAALPERPQTAGIETLVANVATVAERCFRQHTSAGDGVRVTAATQVTLKALPSGKVELVSFDPPLAPPVRACVYASTGGLSVDESRTGLTITRRIELER